MQEPSTLRESGTFQIAQYFPIGYVIKQEVAAPRRVQVRIPLYHTGIADADLPYYRVLQPNDNAGHNGKAGRYSTIAVGTQVMVIIYDSRGYNGVVVGSLPDNTNDISKGGLYGYRDELGNAFDVDKDGNMKLTSMSGASVSFSKDGDVDLTVKNLNIHMDDMTISGDMLTALLSSFQSTSTDWIISANNPRITDGIGGGGGTGTPPTLTKPTLPAAPNVANKTDI